MDVFKRVLAYLKTVKTLIAAALICSILFAFFNLVAIWLSATFIESIFSPSAAAVEESSEEVAEETNIENIQNIESLKEKFNLNKYIKKSTRKLISRDSKLESLKIVCILIFVAFLFKNLFDYLKNIFIVRLNYRIVNLLRNNLYEHLQKL